MSTFKRLLGFVTPFKWWVLLAVFLGFATIGSSVGLMATSAFVISKAALHPGIEALSVAIVGIRFFGIARGIARYTERYISHQLTFKLLSKLRVWFYTALEPLAPARLQQFQSGDLLARIVTDIENLEHFYVRVIAPPLVAILIGILMWILMGAYVPVLAPITIVFLLLAAVGVPTLTRNLSRGIGRDIVTARAKLNAVLVDSIQGIADLLANGRENVQQKTIRVISKRVTDGQNRMALATGLDDALIGLLTHWTILIVLIVAIPLVNDGTLDGIYLAVLALTVIVAFEAVLPLPETFKHLEGVLAAADRLFEVVDTEPVVVDSVSDSPLVEQFSLRVENLRFAYHADAVPALDGINFSLPQGGKLAVVGASGAGKSTLVNLLLRFWAFQQGDILLGEHSLHQFRADDLRQMIGVVSQSTHLFNASIADNLRLSRPAATDDELIIAAKQAKIHTFIQNLPQGYATFIGEQGLQLSGGERQRLAIARALLKDTPILILDEATSNLDPLVEREIMRDIHKLMTGRTTLMITHRLVGLDVMDKIVVLDKGQIIEHGLHRELIERGGTYRAMYDLQQQIDLIDTTAKLE